MENICLNYSTNKKDTFINEEFVKNRIKFFSEFIEYEDEQVKYVVIGLGDDLILNREQLINLIHSSRVKFEIVNCECAIGVLEGHPITIEYY